MRDRFVIPMLALVAAGCGGSQSEPTAPALQSPVLAASLPQRCPTAATVVVTNEAGLLAALASAVPGAVIGIRGTITLTATVVVGIPDLTLTCADRGAGLVADPLLAGEYLIDVYAPRVSVDHLVLDGRIAWGGPYHAVNNGVDRFGEMVRFTDNVVYCGGLCVFLQGGRGAVIADNYFEATLVIPSAATGIHLQRSNNGVGGDDARVERNTLIATVPFGAPAFGAIRIRDGARMVAAHNVIAGPWSNGLAPTNLQEALIEKNSVRGPQDFGMRWVGGGASSVIRNNQFTGAGIAGGFLRGVCASLFIGNNLHGNAGNVGLIFDVPTGANTVVGNQNVVVDNGAFDCDGDGIIDPNIITGRGAVLRGQTLGPLVSDGATQANGLR